MPTQQNLVEKYETFSDFELRKLRLQKDIYGPDFDFFKNVAPDSVFLAKGSEVEIYPGKTIWI